MININPLRGYKKDFKDVIEKLSDILSKVDGEEIKLRNTTVYLMKNYLIINRDTLYWLIYVGSNGITVYYPYYPEEGKIRIEDLKVVLSMDCKGNIAINEEYLYRVLKKKLNFKDPFEYFTRMLKSIYQKAKEIVSDDLLIKIEEFEEFLRKVKEIELE